MTGPLADLLVGWLLFGGVLLAVGSQAGRWLILPRAVSGGAFAPDSRRAAGRVGLVGTCLALAGLALALVRQVAEFRDPFVPLTEDLALLMGSAWGAAWYGALAASVLGLVGFGLAVAGRRVGWWVAVPGVLALSLFPGLTGHAGGEGELRTLTLLADALHVLAAGAWMGGLALVLHLETAHRRRGDGSLLPALVPAFSPVAIGAVALLVGTGSWAAWAHLPGLDSLWATGYGRLLLAKLALVVVVLALGAVNFRILTPRLGGEAGDAAMRRSATVELVVANLVLLVTAVLVRTSPLGH